MTINQYRAAYTHPGVLVIAFTMLALTLPGCGIELAVLGSAASTASTGSAVYKHGKLNASWMAPFWLVRSAAEAAFDDLGLKITRSEGSEELGYWTIVAVNEDDDKAVITIDRKSDRLTEFQIDIGWLGKETTARLILKRMAKYLMVAKTDADMAVIDSPHVKPRFIPKGASEEPWENNLATIGRT